MRKLLVTTLALASVVACSSSEPISKVRLPAPDEPDRNIAVPEPEPKKDERAPADKSLAVATPAMMPNLARPVPLAMVRVRGDEPEIAACGKSSCAAGEYCCNESCGICAPIGGACTQQACEP
jgi:hypothetical protein